MFWSAQSKGVESFEEPPEKEMSPWPECRSLNSYLLRWWDALFCISVWVSLYLYFIKTICALLKRKPGKLLGRMEEAWPGRRTEASYVLSEVLSWAGIPWCCAGGILSSAQGHLCFQGKKSNIFQRPSHILRWLFNTRVYCICLENIYVPCRVFGGWWDKKQVLYKTRVE